MDKATRQTSDLRIQLEEKQAECTKIEEQLRLMKTEKGVAEKRSSEIESQLESTQADLVNALDKVVAADEGHLLDSKDAQLKTLGDRIAGYFSALF